MSMFNPLPSRLGRKVPIRKAATQASLIGFLISLIAAFRSGEYTIFPSFAWNDESTAASRVPIPLAATGFRLICVSDRRSLNARVRSVSFFL